MKAQRAVVPQALMELREIILTGTSSMPHSSLKPLSFFILADHPQVGRDGQRGLEGAGGGLG